MAFWFTSDTHFGSERALIFSQRPFFNVKEMDQTMVNKWNNNILPEDIVYHLGDFGDLSISKYLNGNIRFLVGNYEREDENFLNKVSFCKNIEVLMNSITFDDVYYFALKNDKNDQLEQIELVHEPSHATGNFFTLFGHVHEKCMMKRNGLNVGVDCHYFEPIHQPKINFYKNAIENHYDDEVWSSYCGK